jgi:hypothetical protein
MYYKDTSYFVAFNTNNIVIYNAVHQPVVRRPPPALGFIKLGHTIVISVVLY